MSQTLHAVMCEIERARDYAKRRNRRAREEWARFKVAQPGHPELAAEQQITANRWAGRVDAFEVALKKLRRYQRSVP